MSIVSIVLLLAVVVGIIIIVTSGNNANSLENELERLEFEYETALLGLDKRAALKAGRLYYAMRRKDKTLSIYDEQAIANDLSTMPQKVHFSTPDNAD